MKLRDFFDQELNVGDLVAYLHHSRTSSELRMSEIVGFTTAFVRVKDGPRDTRLVSPYKVIRK